MIPEFKSKIVLPKTYLLKIDIQLEKLDRDLSDWFNVSREILSIQASDDKINKLSLLRKFRERSYENINQLLHRALILKAAQMFQLEYTNIIRWTWHPSQTSKPNFADLTGYDQNDNIIVNAEITTSKKALGVISQRMAMKLRELSKMPGDKFYIVANEIMKKSAIRIIKASNLNIKVIVIQID